MTLRVILHGGLGNQLFQLFFAQLEADDRRLSDVEAVTAMLGSYEISRGVEVQPLADAGLVPTRFVAPISRLERARLPKVLWKLTGREFGLGLGRRRLIDGYYQSPEQYAGFDKRRMDSLREGWRAHLLAERLIAVAERPRLLHIRLADFARGRDPREVARDRLAAVEGAWDLISDDEAAVSAALEDLQAVERLRLLTTANMTSWDVLSLMSRYGAVHTNGSSLACWAAALGNAVLESNNPQHEAFVRLLQSRN
jgi:hypothetical protein